MLSMALTDQKGNKSGSLLGFTYPLIHECLGELGTCTQRPVCTMENYNQHSNTWYAGNYHRYDRKIALCTFITYITSYIR